MGKDRINSGQNTVTIHLIVPICTEYSLGTQAFTVGNWTIFIYSCASVNWGAKTIWHFQLRFIFTAP